MELCRASAPVGVRRNGAATVKVPLGRIRLKRVWSALRGVNSVINLETVSRTSIFIHPLSRWGSGGVVWVSSWVDADVITVVIQLMVAQLFHHMYDEYSSALF